MVTDSVATPRRDCPSHEVLLAFSQGRLEEDASSDILQHIDTCETCEGVLETLEDRDSLVHSIQAAYSSREVQDESELPAAEDLRQLQQRVDQIALPLGSGYEPTDPGAVRPPQLTVRQLGPYYLESLLGAGGMGAVYRAFHVNLKRTVALKLLPQERSSDPRFLRRFYAEMAAIGKLDHPHLVRAYDAGEASGYHFISMEFVDGKDLSAILRRIGPLTVPEACTIAVQVAEGLDYVQQHGLVHRDLKPSNLLLSTSGKVKIVDLGLAKLALEESSEGELTGSQQVVGTADYLAPEQIKPGRALDVRTDIYSLGATLYKLLAGSAPFSGKEHGTVAAKLVAHCSEKPDPVRSRRAAIPEEISAAIDRMLAKDPAERLQTPQEVIDTFSGYCGTSDLSRLIQAIVKPPDDVDPDVRTATLDTDGGRSEETLTEPRPLTKAPSQGGVLALVIAVPLLIALAVGTRYVVNRDDPQQPIQPVAALPPRKTPAEQNPTPGIGQTPPVPRTKHFCELQADEIESLRWYSLLDRDPHRLIWPRRSEVSSTALDQHRDQLYVQVSDTALLELGTVHTGNYVFSVDMYQGRWSGGIGVFFGFREDWDGETRYITYQALRFSHSQLGVRDRYFVSRTIEKLTFKPGKYPSPFLNTIASAEVEKPAPTPQSLELTVRGNKLRSVRFGGVTLAELINPMGAKDLIPDDHIGPFGLFAELTEVSFRNARIMQLEVEDEELRPNEDANERS